MDRETKKKYDRLEEISKELFDMANSCAGDKLGWSGAYLHQAVGSIHTAQKIFEGEDIQPTKTMIAESMGINIWDNIFRDVLPLVTEAEELLRRDESDENT